MKLPPHGDVSIGDALVALANKEYFIERQGNFGNVVTGHPAAAARYIECRLTDLAKETLFRKALTEYRDGIREHAAMTVVGGLRTMSDHDLRSLAAYLADIVEDVDDVTIDSLARAVESRRADEA